ncbi:MAG: DUF2442 domain-containing protein, partial [bacterium]
MFIVSEDGRSGEFDVSPYLKYEAFNGLRDQKEFQKISNGGYFIEWDCGADLSADTIEARWHVRDFAFYQNRNTGLAQGSIKA